MKGVHLSVQLEVQDRVGKMADLDEQLAEMHKRLEKQLLQQLDTEELLRYSESCMLLLVVHVNTMYRRYGPQEYTGSERLKSLERKDAKLQGSEVLCALSCRCLRLSCKVDVCRKHEEDIRETQAETAHINDVVAEKDAAMAELKRQAAQGRPSSAGASSSARAAPSSSQKHDSKGKGDDDSPKSNMSSPWGTDVSCCHILALAGQA